MKRIFLVLLLMLSFGGAALAGTSVFVNNGTLTTRTNIDAQVFINRGLIYYDLLGSFVVDSTLFQTRDTLNFTNNGIMIAQPGFNFQTVTATTVKPAASFSLGSSGTIQGVDAPPGFLVTGSPPTFTSPLSITPGTNSAVPSAIVVSANNINVNGSMTVGDIGDIQLSGSTINLNSAFLAAGTLSELDTNATLGRGIDFGVLNGATLYPFFSPPAETYDIAWDFTNSTAAFNIEDFAAGMSLNPPLLEIFTPAIAGTRNGNLEGIPLNGTVPGYGAEVIFPFYMTQTTISNTPAVVTSPVISPNFVPFAYNFTVSGTLETNYINVVLVNSAFADPDVTVQVAFAPQDLGLYADPYILTNGNVEGTEIMVKFSAPVLDIVSGQTVTNSIYFLDTSDIQIPNLGASNDDYDFTFKPLGFEITRTLPIDWEFGIPANGIFDPTLLYTDGEFQNFTGTITNSFYVAEVGRNPEVPYGLSDYSATVIGTTETGMPDLTNAGGHIEINALKTNNVTNMRLRANALVQLSASNFVGSPAATDFGNMNLNLANGKGSLLVSNILPATFHRLRGAVGGYAATWFNIQTNDGISAAKITNYYYYHVLIVDQDLRDTFKTTALNVALSGSNIVLGDPLRVITSASFKATNLTFNSGVQLTGAAGTLQSANLPGLKNLLVGPNGSITADNAINIGVTASASPVNPTKQNTPVASITNLGAMTSELIELQSQIYAHGGTNTASNFGSIIINAITNYLGAGRLGLTNALIADGDVELTSASIQVTNSTILAGQAGNGALMLHATTELTDHVPNTASTNSYHTNVWQVTDGFSLLAKPTKGDLFGTEIKTLSAIPNRSIDHVWAGQDLGASAAGFFNNAVIGHLVLDRTADNSSFHFKGAGSKNALYVDYLDLEDLSFSDYHSGLTVDPNLTIYFASANVDPAKLHAAYSNVVWVPQFAGPNSTASISYTGGSNCLMNATVATSSTIDTDGDGIVNLNDSALLNNPSQGAVPCPSLVTTAETRSVTNGLNGQQFILWVTGRGTVSPALPTKGLGAGQRLTLTATPAPGWLFVGWSGSVISSSSTVSFTVPNVVFSFATANFITNPFIALQGVYNGLFSVPGGVTNNSSGAVTFTLNSQGVFSGKLTMNSTNYTFNSQFNLGNTAAFNATSGHNVLAVTLQVGLDALADEATGTVGNSQFSANLVAYHTPSWSTANPAPQTGTYTLDLPGNPNAAASPGGDGYGTVTVDKLGNLKAIGVLANGASFSQSVPVSKEGQWPLYFVPAGVPQPVFGWVTFDTNGVGGTASGFSGAVTWIKSPGAGAYYPNGFTNTSLLDGNLYSAGRQRTNGLALTGPSITLTGGNLAATVNEAVSLISAQTYQSPDKTLTLTINPTTGEFSGQYAPPGMSKKYPLAGAVLQNEGTAHGYFLGTSQSGAVLLQGN